MLLLWISQRFNPPAPRSNQGNPSMTSMLAYCIKFNVRWASWNILLPLCRTFTFKLLLVKAKCICKRNAWVKWLDNDSFVLCKLETIGAHIESFPLHYKLFQHVITGVLSHSLKSVLVPIEFSLSICCLCFIALKLRPVWTRNWVSMREIQWNRKRMED